MAWVTAHFYSEVLDLQTTVQVLLPEADNGIGVTNAVWDGRTELPVLYLLHGSSDDSTIWLRRTSLDRSCAGRTMAVVIPECGKSMFVDMKYGYAYYKYLVEELPKKMNRFFRISTEREKMFVAGLSMGGYGSILAGLKNPEKYCKVASMSGPLDLEYFPLFDAYRKMGDKNYLEKLEREEPALRAMLYDLELCYGSYEEWKDSDWNLMRLLRQRIQEKAGLPEMMISICTEDMLYQTNTSFRKELDRHKVTYSYFEEPGIHEWAVWDRHIQKVLDWVSPMETIRFENQLAKKVADGQGGTI